MLVCGRSQDDFLGEIEKFHGWKAPGLVMGAFMVDWAQELMGPGVEADAIVETIHCLPDAVQIFTPCTVGNGWLKILDWDKYALSLFDRRKTFGYRVWFDLNKARKFPDLYNWYMRLVPKDELPLETVIEAILHAKRDALSSRAIKVIKYSTRKKKGDIGVCSGCGESYPTAQGSQCIACQGDGYYEPE